MITKEKIIQTVRELPDDFSIDDLFDRIILLENFEKGMKDIKEGNTLSHEEVKNKYKQWLD